MAQANKIVFPTDFSEPSLKALAWIRDHMPNSEVHCLNVVQPPAVYLPMMSGTAVESLPASDEIVEMTTASLDEFAGEHLQGLAVEPVTKVLIGRPIDEIVDYADEIGAAAIVIATHGRSGLAHVMLGSTAEGVVRHAKCPVVTVRA